jgi:NADH-quinone oxidoreductase subunit N
MVMAADLMTFFLGLETMSIPVYALAAMRANDARSSEAALKYFLVGAFATGFLLFGVALVLGAAGRVDYVGIAAALGSGARVELASLGVLLVLVGFAFKVSAVPFHMWAPDAYEGAPTPVTGFMATGVKAAAFLALVRVVMVALVPAELSAPVWVPALSGLATLTILIGNALALVQNNVKRMLAYSSVAHAGYALVGVVAAAKGEPSAGGAVLFYLTAYTFTTLGAFGVLVFLERADGGIESERFGAFAGVGYRHPALGLSMIVFMVALAGMPPTGGFFGKLNVFAAAIRADELGLAVVGVVGSVVSIHYYLRVLVAFYMREHAEPGPAPAANPSFDLGLGIGAAVLLTLALGILPGRWLGISSQAGAELRVVARDPSPAALSRRAPEAARPRPHRGAYAFETRAAGEDRPAFAD